MNGTVEGRCRRIGSGFVAEVVETSASTARVGQYEVSRVGNHMKNHITSIEADDCIGMGSEIIEEMIAGLVGSNCRLSLFVRDFIERRKNDGIDGSTIIQKGTGNRLDSSSAFLVE
jgi:hypothetical protein